MRDTQKMMTISATSFHGCNRTFQIFFIFIPLGKILILTNIFQRGWNHQHVSLSHFVVTSHATEFQWQENIGEHGVPCELQGFF